MTEIIFWFFIIFVFLILLFCFVLILIVVFMHKRIFWKISHDEHFPQWNPVAIFFERATNTARKTYVLHWEKWINSRIDLERLIPRRWFNWRRIHIFFFFFRKGKQKDTSFSFSETNIEIDFVDIEKKKTKENYWRRIFSFFYVNNKKIQKRKTPKVIFLTFFLSCF